MVPPDATPWPTPTDRDRRQAYMLRFDIVQWVATATEARSPYLAHANAMYWLAADANAPEKS